MMGKLMIELENCVLLQLKKTGSTTAERLLTERYTCVKHQKHMQLRKPINKKVYCFVRNPFDWYVSMWAFSRMQKGSLFHFTTGKMNKIDLAKYSMLRFLRHKKLPVSAKYLKYDNEFHKEFNTIYCMENEKESFRAWLKLILSEKAKHFLLGDTHFGNKKNTLGYFTMQFLRISSHEKNWLEYLREMDVSPADWYSKYSVVDHYFKLEKFDDFIQAFGLFGEHSQLAENRSLRQRYQEYYDEDCKKLVIEKDYLIFELFNYEF